MLRLLCLFVPNGILFLRCFVSSGSLTKQGAQPLLDSIRASAIAFGRVIVLVSSCCSPRPAFQIGIYLRCKANDRGTCFGNKMSRCTRGPIQEADTMGGTPHSNCMLLKCQNAVVRGILCRLLCDRCLSSYILPCREIRPMFVTCQFTKCVAIARREIQHKNSVSLKHVRYTSIEGPCKIGS